MLAVMPHAQQHRGAHPEDRELFSSAAIVTLRQAVQDCVYLLDRGYSTDSVLDLVGSRYALRTRQRLALRRVVCSTDRAGDRRSKQREPQHMSGELVEIDGFNLVIGLEVALSGGVLLQCHDGAIRDLAGLRGTYRMVDETATALDLLGAVLHEFRPRALRLLLDRPVSNSGRLRARILEQAATWTFDVEVELVANPDRELGGRELVVSSDSVVLDTAASWVNLLAYIVQHRVPTAWVVDFAARGLCPGPSAA
jgi:hypothetical protein